jgi:hypothetical protein
MSGTAATRPPQEARDRSLRDADAELAQFAVNPRCTPQWVGRRHLSHQRVDVLLDGRADRRVVVPNVGSIGGGASRDAIARPLGPARSRSRASPQPIRISNSSTDRSAGLRGASHKPSFESGRVFRTVRGGDPQNSLRHGIRFLALASKEITSRPRASADAQLGRR